MKAKANVDGRQNPDREYATKSELEAARVINISVTPYHIFLLEQVFGENAKPSASFQSLLEERASDKGMGVEQWNALSDTDKEKYVKGVRQKSSWQRMKEKRERTGQS